jgi:hypothetical protein
MSCVKALVRPVAAGRPGSAGGLGKTTCATRQHLKPVPQPMLQRGRFKSSIAFYSSCLYDTSLKTGLEAAVLLTN